MDFEWCVVGLGNPGRKYALTRHNAGFCVCDALSKRWGFSFSKKLFKAQFNQSSYAFKKILVVKPQTYMNLSGESVKSLMGYFSLSPEQLLLVYDDMDTPKGRLRLRKKGSPGGHNGVESVLSQLGTNDIYRVRVGIGRPACAVHADRLDENSIDDVGYVLGVVKGNEKKLLESAVQGACEAVETIIEHGMEKAMNIFNVRRCAP